MSTTSTAASSTLARSRIAVFSIAAVATITAGYFLYRNGSFDSGDVPPPGAGLHRSNAIRHPRRRSTNVADEATALADATLENGGEGEIDHFAPRTLTDGETVVDDQAFPEEYGWTNLPQSYQRNGQNIVQLLFRVSEDATRRNAYIHRGCACNSCGVVPIRGIRYRCANCADYDLCEGCESQGLHTKTHIFYKVRVPAPPFGPRCIQPVWYSGDPDTIMRTLPKETLAKLSRETGFERPELDAYWEQWTFMANTDWRDDPDDINLAMDRKTFERCLVPSGGHRHTAPSLIFDRMFAFYDTNKDDLISFPEFLHGIGYRKKKEKWIKVFEGYDIDGDGYVDRRDFLRMFRSYYVLYRQMHRDMLEGMEEQQMTSTEAHRLVSSRQPLSSAFGTDGRYPRAPDPRTGEGKVTHANGDQEIVDGKGIINESGNDTGNREDLFRKDVPRIVRSHWEGERPSDNTAFLAAVLNPPETIEQMPDVLRNLRRVRGQVANLLRDDPDFTRHDDDEDGGSDSEDASSEPESDHTWPPTFVTVTDEDAEAVDGYGTRVEDVQRSSRRAVISHAVYRERAQREIYERWQRRHFYTDEEEGATPPANWKEDDDILAHNGIGGESSKAPSRPIIHSRSSSKVRFAEDMDDFDTRSNPSTSSRSVPERWGGIEIPDAERDAGKEILFQVTQQAFNELLDPIFKNKEDMAIEAAQTKEDREKYRHLYSTPEFEQWALSKEEASKENDQEKPIPQADNFTANPVWPNFSEIEVEQVRERPLEDLLAATGYQVDTDQQEDAIPDLEPVNDSEVITQTESTSQPLAGEALDSPNPVPMILQAPAPAVSEAAHAALRLDLEEAIREPLEYRDPTLPQFRPDSEYVPEYVHVPESSAMSAYTGTLPIELDPDMMNPNGVPEAFFPMTRGEYYELFTKPHGPPVNTASPLPESNAEKEKEKEQEPSKVRLYKLWKLDKASKEAELRGGWGRLNFAEFETNVKDVSKEGRDYLGSWIEFCIP